MQLKKTVKEMIKKSKSPDYDDEIKLFFEFCDVHHIRKLSPKERPESLIGQNIFILLQSNLTRSKMLAESYVQGLNKKNPIMTALSVRAYFENTGVLTFLLKKYNQYRDATISEETFDSLLESLYLGVRDKRLLEGYEGDIPDPISVMKLIDTIDHFNKKKYGIKKDLIRRGYEDLSEICHPNSFSYFFGKKIDERLVIHFEDNIEYSIKDFRLPQFVAITAIYMEAYKDLKTAIVQNEELPFIEI